MVEENAKATEQKNDAITENSTAEEQPTDQSKIWLDVKPRQEGDVIIYARVSTPSQDIRRQVQRMHEQYPEAKIVMEVYTGSSTDRPKWDKIMRKARMGHVKKIIFDDASRMSREKEAGFALYKELYEMGVELVFVKEPHINTEQIRKLFAKQMKTQFNSGDYATDTLMTQIIQALNQYVINVTARNIAFSFEASEKELMLLRKRTSEGLRQAKLRGKHTGGVVGCKRESKQSKRGKRIIKKHLKLFGGTLEPCECYAMCEVMKPTYYKYVGEVLIEEAYRDIGQKLLDDLGIDQTVEVPDGEEMNESKRWQILMNRVTDKLYAIEGVKFKKNSKQAQKDRETAEEKIREANRRSKHEER